MSPFDFPLNLVTAALSLCRETVPQNEPSREPSHTFFLNALLQLTTSVKTIAGGEGPTNENCNTFKKIFATRLRLGHQFTYDFEYSFARAINFAFVGINLYRTRIVIYYFNNPKV